MPALQIIALDTTTPQLRAPAGGDTYSAPRAIELTPETLTGSTATSSLAITQTWNTTGTPTAINLNVTDTASNAASLLMDLRVGGNSLFRVGKAGNAIAPISSAATPAYAMGANATGIYSRSATLRLNFSIAGNDAGVEIGSGLIALASTAQLAWVTTTLSGSSPDLFLVRDAANTLALRNGVNAQAFRVYNTFTDASNYERLSILGNVTSFRIAGEAAGTGASRSVTFDTAAGSGGIVFATGGTSRWAVSSSAGSGHFIASADNTYDIGLSGSNRPRNLFLAAYQEMSEMTAPAAPGTNNVRIYAEDNGSGKTRLMALFATGAAQQIAIEP